MSIKLPSRLVAKFNPTDEPDIPFRVTCAKILSTFFLEVALFAAGLQSTVFAGMGTTVEEAYDCKYELTNFTVTAFGVAALLASVPANHFLAKYGIRKSCITGAVIMAVGTSLRVLINYRFMFAVIGQAVTGIAMPLLLNGIHVYSDQSFTKRKVPVQVGFLILAVVGGICFGPILSKLFENHYASNDIVRKEVLMWCIINCALCVALAILIPLFIRRDKNRFKHRKHRAEIKDSTGSSSSNRSRSSSVISTGSTSSADSKFVTLLQAEKLIEYEKDELQVTSKFTVTQQYAVLLGDKCFVYSILGGGFVQGVICSKLTLDSQIYAPSGFLATTTAYAGAIFCTISSIMILYNFLSPKYKRQMYYAFANLQIISAFGLGIVVLGLYLKIIYVLLIGETIYAIGAIISLSIIIEAISKRVGKDLDLVATASTFSFGQIVSAIIFSISDWFLDSTSPELAYLTYIIVGAMALILLLAGLFAVFANRHKGTRLV